jgi:hypothetical protein
VIGAGAGVSPDLGIANGDFVVALGDGFALGRLGAVTGAGLTLIKGVGVCVGMGIGCLGVTGVILADGLA